MSSSTHPTPSGAIEISSHHVKQASSHAGSSPVKAMTAGNAASPAPSPAATFVKMAAAAAAAGVPNTPEGSTKIATSAEKIEMTKQKDPLVEMISNADAFLNVQLRQLEKVGNLFFDQYENALSDYSDSRKVVQAHRNLLTLYDQLLVNATQSGLAAIPCANDVSKNKVNTESLEELQSRLARETKETFERRERLREGASMVTGILMQNQNHK